MDIVVCPSTNEIQQLLSGHLESELAARLTDHVQVCSNCMLAIQNLRPNRPEAVAFPPVADHTLASAAGEDSQLRKLLASKAAANQLPFLSPPAGPDELGRLPNPN